MNENQVQEEQELTPEQKAKQARDLEICRYLLKSERFVRFVDDNYLIQQKIDHDKKTVELVVLEKPVAVGPPLTSEQVTGILGVLKAAKCPDAIEVADAIMAILGQQDREHRRIITGVSEADIRELSKDAKKKLD